MSVVIFVKSQIHCAYNVTAPAGVYEAPSAKRVPKEPTPPVVVQLVAVVDQPINAYPGRTNELGARFAVPVIDWVVVVAVPKFELKVTVAVTALAAGAPR